LWLVGTTNLINLVDGVDGLAGGICLMLMSLLAYECNSTTQLMAAGMAGALIGFLRFNFPPARIYLGDGGAYFLGFQIGLFSLISSQKGTIAAALVAPMFVLGLPILDMALAITRRGLRGLPVFRADRNHLHHHLLEMGFSRRKVVLSIYAVTLIFMVMGFVAFWSNGRWTAALVGLCALILLLCAGRLRFSREWFAVGRTVGNSLAMRQDIQSAVCLTRWLVVEARRKGSAENLWSDLVFVAQRLGFASVTATANGATKNWQRSTGETHCFKNDSGSASLELRALKQTEQPLAAGSRLTNAKLFFITSELLAEAWSNAIKNWEEREHRAFNLSEMSAEEIPLSEPFTPARVISQKAEFLSSAQINPQTVSN
jgi:UDP-GlcNAc:undecaprenyl-phosphate GlcNAc-1-phosphate transferase